MSVPRSHWRRHPPAPLRGVQMLISVEDRSWERSAIGYKSPVDNNLRRRQGNGKALGKQKDKGNSSDSSSNSNPSHQADHPHPSAKGSPKDKNSGGSAPPAQSVPPVQSAPPAQAPGNPPTAAPPLGTNKPSEPQTITQSQHTVTVSLPQPSTTEDTSSQSQTGGAARPSSIISANITQSEGRVIAGGASTELTTTGTTTSGGPSPTIGPDTPALSGTTTLQPSESSSLPSAQAATQGQPKQGQHIGVAVGLGIGIFFGLLLIAAAILLFMRRRRTRRLLREKLDEDDFSFIKRGSTYKGSVWTGSEETGDVYFPTTVASSSVRSPSGNSDIFSMAATSLSGTHHSFYGSRSKAQEAR
ncbi:hypothetical protein CPC08DRAFT_754513 [Agrocybe pediades]|nr:hypothetical protein CPC08DRAFT_754513 [Agrocybe pediades]